MANFDSYKIFTIADGLKSFVDQKPAFDLIFRQIARSGPHFAHKWSGDIVFGNRRCCVFPSGYDLSVDEADVTRGFGLRQRNCCSDSIKERGKFF